MTGSQEVVSSNPPSPASYSSQAGHRLLIKFLASQYSLAVIRPMKILLTTIAALVLVGCGESQQWLQHQKRSQNRRQPKHQTSQFTKLPKQETSKPSNSTWRLVRM